MANDDEGLEIISGVWDVAGKGDKRAARRAVQRARPRAARAVSRRRRRQAVGEAGLCPAGATAGQGLEMSAGEVLVWIVWVAAAVALLSSGVAVVLFRNPFYSALALIANLAALAVLYLLLSAEFVAAAQVLVYAGAIVVMFLFVIAYVGGQAPWEGGPSLQSLAAVLAAGAIAVEVVVAVALEADGRLSKAAEITSAFGSPREIGLLFLSDHLLAFEATSIVLLVAAVGGVILGTALPEEREESRE